MKEKRNKGKSIKCPCGGKFKHRPVNKNRPQVIHLICTKCGKKACEIYA